MEIKTKNELEAALQTGQGELFDAGIPEKIYRKHEAIAQSDLKTVNALSPLHYLKNRYHHIEKETPAKILGEAMHTAFFEPDSFNSRHSVLPEINRRTKEGKIQYAAFLEGNKGKTILTFDQKLTIDRMLENIRKIPEIKKYINGGKVERCFFAPPPHQYEDRIPVSRKIRVDYWIENEPMIVDLKTTMCAAKGPFIQSVLKYGYFVQNAYYADLLKHFGYEVRFVFIVVEKVQPFDVAVYELDAEFIKQGRAMYTEGLRQLAVCFESDSWPGYDKQCQTLECPEWTKRQWKQQMLEALSD